MKANLAPAVLCLAVLVVSSARLLAQTAYFPANAFDSDKASDQFVAQWFAGQLTALGEPSLFSLSQDRSTESYRFLWLRTFNHPVAVRVDVRADGTATVMTKIADGAAGYSPGTLITNTSRALTRQETDNLLLVVKRSGFWSLSGHIPSNGGLDGAEWSIEGVRSGAYHIVTRWTPRAGPVYTLERFFLFDLAGLKVPKKEFY